MDRQIARHFEQTAHEHHRAEREPREPLAVVTIDIARHSVKDKTQEDDRRTALHPEGMAKAAAAGRERGDDHTVTAQIEQDGGATIYGSMRDRTVQSSVMRMLGERFRDVDLSHTDPAELVAWLEEGGLKIIQQELLDFTDGSPRYSALIGQKLDEKALVTWFLQESDDAARRLSHGIEATTVSTAAADIATFLYCVGRTTSAQLMNGKKGRNRELVFATTHQGLLESFLYKAIRQEQGEETAREFVDSLGSDLFAENQGIRVDYEVLGSGDKDWQMKITYNDHQYVLEPDDVEQILQEGEAFRHTLGVTSNKH